MDFRNILWISHSALSAYARCPKLYYYEYVYRNPKTGNRIQIVNPYLSLGSAVHETIEGLADIPDKEREKISLKERFKKIFNSYKGKVGGFVLESKEEEFFSRGLKMVERVEKSNFLEKPSTKMESNFPKVDLIGDEVKLVGSVDWIEILPGGGAHIIDFKTGNNKEVNGSLQLPIYTILAKENLSMSVEKVSYWYLQHDDEPEPQEVGNLDRHLESIKEKALAVREAIKKDHFPCRYNGKCFACGEYEKLFAGQAEMVGSDTQRKKDLFLILDRQEVVEKILEKSFLSSKEKNLFEERIGKKVNNGMKADKETVLTIKEKLKKNLTSGELKTVVELLRENG